MALDLLLPLRTLRNVQWYSRSQAPPLRGVRDAYSSRISLSQLSTGPMQKVSSSSLWRIIRVVRLIGARGLTSRRAKRTRLNNDVRGSTSMTAPIIRHAELSEVADDVEHPIPALGVLTGTTVADGFDGMVSPRIPPSPNTTNIGSLAIGRRPDSDQRGTSMLARLAKAMAVTASGITRSPLASATQACCSLQWMRRSQPCSSSVSAVQCSTQSPSLQ